MDRKIKRYIVYVVCMAVLLTAIPLQPVKAESTEPSISLNESTVTAGSYFYSYLSAKDFENISALKLTIRYDADAFSFYSKYAYSLLDGSLTDINASTPGEIHISIMNSDGITGTGNLFRLQFQAKSSTSAGNYSLKISVDEACDTELNSISIGKSNGTVTVKEVAQTVQTISFSGSCSPSKAAYEDSVVYTISNRSGSDLAGGTFTVQYDADKLTFAEVTKGKLLDKANALYDVNDNGKGTLRITFMADQNIYASYGPDLLNIHFTVKQNCNATTTITTTPSNLTKTSLESLKAASFETSLQLEEKKEEEPVTDEMSLVLSEEVSDGVFTIDTILHSEKGMAAGDFIIQYDKNAVKCKNVTKDDSVLDTGSYLVTKEKIDDGEVAFSLVNTKGLTGEYTLLHLEFELIDPNAESTIISINGQDIVGVDGDAIRVKFNSATVEVPTPEPTPTVSPSEAPTPSPSVTPEPTVTPTSSPEVIGPTVKPSEAPTASPTVSAEPSVEPTSSPTVSAGPSVEPTASPTSSPEVIGPTVKPSEAPTASPTVSAGPSVTPEPTITPTSSPEVIGPTVKPSEAPTPSPTVSAEPSVEPTPSPSITPEPTLTPTSSPEVIGPTVKPSEVPTTSPTVSAEPSVEPTSSPEVVGPTVKPSEAPTTSPTIKPSATPTLTPTSSPEVIGPTVKPSEAPTSSPIVSASPSVTPEPTLNPTSSPTSSPTVSAGPSAAPTLKPTSTPKPSPNADKVWFETSNMEENGKISAKLYVNSTHGLAAADFYLTYDKQYLLCKKAEISSEAGKNAQITLNPNIEDGFVRFSYINLSGLNTKCCLVELEFEVISDQKTTTTLTSSIQDAVDTEFNDLTFICNNIDVKINETAQEPSKPTPTPVTSMQPSATPIPTASAIPTVKPSTAPTSSPVVSAEPSESPTASAQPTTSPGNVTPTGTPSDVVNPGESLVPGQTPENNSSYDSEWGTNKSVKINKPVIKKAVNKKRRKLQITLKKMSQISGFQCYYSTKKNFKKKKRITSKKYKFTLKKLSKKRYYIKVRAFRIEQNGVKRFGKWSKIKKVKVKK